jgi:DNA repair exonuclease SbcCD ATPase subunit
MSIHSIVASNITDYSTLIAVLNESGIRWWSAQAIDTRTRAVCAHAVQAVIGRETVLIWQYSPGEAFCFQSAGWSFQNKGRVEMIATREPEAVRRCRDQVEQQRQEQEQLRQEEERRQHQLLEQQRQLEEQRQREGERLRREETERQRHLAELRRQEEERRQWQQLEQQRQLEEQRRREEEQRCREEIEQQRLLEEEQRRLEAERRKKTLAEEVTQLLSRSSSTLREPVPSAPPLGPAPMPPFRGEPSLAVNRPSDNQLNEVIGRLHQEIARRKILQHREELEERGFILESQETLDDQTIELRFRG